MTSGHEANRTAHVAPPDRACVELLAVLELPERERAALIGQLYWSQGSQALAEVRFDVESDPGVR